MKITINTYWFYGYLVYNLGIYKCEEDLKRSRFYWRETVYESSWLACQALSGELHKLQPYQPAKYNPETFEVVKDTRVMAGQIGGESVIGVRVDAEVDRLNVPPEEAELAFIKKTMWEVLEKVGLKNLPEPKLYFMVDIGDD